jgi:hypothetical protein
MANFIDGAAVVREIRTLGTVVLQTAFLQVALAIGA